MKITVDESCVTKVVLLRGVYNSRVSQGMWFIVIVLHRTSWSHNFLSNVKAFQICSYILFAFIWNKRKKGKERKKWGYHHEFCKVKRISNYGKLDVIILTILSRVAIKFECPIRSEIHTDLAWYAIGILQSG